MKVSIIVSVYNMEEYIDKCVTSVLEQSFTDFELILINDGSFDKTDEVCRKWEKVDDRIVYVSKINEGLGISRNKGIKMSCGEYVTFLDADDWLAQDYLEKLVSSAISHDSDIVIGDLFYVSLTEGGFTEKISAIRLPDGVSDPGREKNYFGKCRTFLCGKLFRKDMFVKYDTWLPGHNYEDISVTAYLISKAGTVSHIGGAIYYYFRNREGSIINDFSHLPNIKLSMGELVSRFENDGSFEKYRLQLMNLCWGQVCNVFNLTRSRFADNDGRRASEICDDILGEFLKIFPEGKRIVNARFYVDEDDVIRRAVRNIVLGDEQIVDNLEMADVLVYWKDGKEYADRLASKGKLEILIDKNQVTDKETLIWDISDELFWELFK